MELLCHIVLERKIKLRSEKYDLESKKVRIYRNQKQIGLENEIRKQVEFIIKFCNFMIYAQNQSKKPLNESNNQKLNRDSKKNINQNQIAEMKNKKKQFTGCFCFSFNKKKDPSNNIIHPNQSIKDQALRMSRQIATKSFKNITKPISTTTIFNQKSQTISKTVSPKNLNALKNENFHIFKNGTVKEQKQFQKKKLSKQKKPSQFNMNKLTFSAVNKSYQKNVNTTTNTSTNQSISIDNSIVSGSLVYLKKSNDRVLQTSIKKSQDPKREIQNIKKQSIKEKKILNKVLKYKPISSTRQISVKNINLLKKNQQFQSIKQENQQFEIKKPKVIKIKDKKATQQLKDKKPSQKKIKIINFDSGNHKIQVKKIQTQQQIHSNETQNSDLDQIRYDYSSIVIDYFNPTPQMIQKINYSHKLILQEEKQKTQDILLFLETKKQKNPSIIENPQSEIIQNSSNSVSQSNVRQLNNNSSSNSSFESNLLSFSMNQINNCNDISCSFESIAKREPKFSQRNENIFDGLGLSLINQNQQSEVYKNQSDVSQYHSSQIQNQNQNKN